MKKSQYLSCMFYAALFAYLLISNKILFNMKQAAQQSYNMLIYIVISTIIFFLSGIILGLEHFWHERCLPGQWKLNWPKIVCLGVPSLSISLIFFFYNYLPINIQQTILSTGFFPLLFGSSLPSLFQLIFGLTLITSFYKENEGA